MTIKAMTIRRYNMMGFVDFPTIMHKLVVDLATHEFGIYRSVFMNRYS